MTISIIAAVAENNVIGKNGQLPWHLPADLMHFKNLTMGHHIIMGRKTFESVGKPLPGRTNIIISRQNDLKEANCIVVHSLDEAIKYIVEDNEPFICGGAEIYKQAFDIADKMYLTRIHEEFDGDTFFPEINMNVWTETGREDFEPDDKNKYAYSFFVFKRIMPLSVS